MNYSKSKGATDGGKLGPSEGGCLHPLEGPGRAWMFIAMIVGATYIPTTPAEAAVQETELRSQAAKSCHDAKTENDIDDCYVRALKYYRGHPQDLLQLDLRDALTYCDLAGESNDAAFCTDLFRKHSGLHGQLIRERIEAGTRRAKMRAEVEARKPKTEPVIAKGVSVIPGAIVCPDYRTVSVMISWYNAHWADTLEDTITRGQSRLMRGAATRSPDFARFGCALIAPGTPMTVERGSMVPVVEGKLPNGKPFRGVTDPSMLQR